MITAVISILIITATVWLATKKSAFKICPICAGVSLTWMWLLVGLWSGKLAPIDYQLPTAVLMGGTVVGLMAKLESKIKPKLAMLWKTIFIVSGFSAAASLLAGDWLVGAAGIILAMVATLALKTTPAEMEKQTSTATKELEEKMKNCC
ncbi:MAG TPA: hypothetical protein VJL36_01090 [Candidatus Paceibacterota bacterium]